ncbi:toxin-antitoxin system HicB family antitoxin [Variovorax soli]|uniref:Arc-like DNA binding domain-containing protein n=1 Tax=Variovorax soli TaxID=376815 RepID=A0ABU1NK37_9BURK|nr:hypothetical protein [Variovorax soli]MDR6538840.1 hypothetical protein [Variovorax soli]
MEDEDRYTRITLRIPKLLHSQLQGEADKTSKSLNAEIVARLSASFDSKNQSAGDLAKAVTRLDLLQRRESVVRQLEAGTSRLEMHRLRRDINRANMSKEDFSRWLKEEREMQDWIAHMEFSRQLLDREIAVVDGAPLPPVDATR